MTTELDALQNAAIDLQIEIKVEILEDKRKTLKKYFATKNNTVISPDTDELN